MEAENSTTTQSSYNENKGTSDDEKLRKLLKPKASSKQIVQVLEESYCNNDIDGSTCKVIKELESYDDNNFLVSIQGTKYLLKVSNGVETLSHIKQPRNSVIHLQNMIFQQLPKFNLTSNVPQKRKNAKENEDPYVSLHYLPVVSSDHSPRLLVVRLLKWVEGVPMSSMASLSPKVLAEAGMYLGKTCVALDQLHDESNPELGEWFHAWDGKQTKEVRNFLSCIEDSARREMIDQIIKQFEEQVLPDSSYFRTGILQADFNDANIIMKDGKVHGVIDFGDTCKSWRVLDITVAMAYAMLTSYGKQNHSLTAAASFLRGFHSQYPLTPQERKHLRTLMTCRLACSVTLGAYSYQQNPENKYLLLHAEPAWETLEFLTGQENKNVLESMDKLFAKACDSAIFDSNGALECSDLIVEDDKINLSKSISTSSKKRKRGLHEITFVTGNKKKLEEVKRILSSSDKPLPFEITNCKIDLPELQGDPSDIAKEKCSLAAKQIDGPVITEDTSLCYNAYQGLPGPYIKWFLEKCGHEGLNKLLDGYDDKRAYAQTMVAFCTGPDKEVHIFDGRTKGKIVPARGKLDFGWDPVFEPEEGNGKTYAEMTKEEKDAISHRSRAFNQLRNFFISSESKLKCDMDKND